MRVVVRVNAYLPMVLLAALLSYGCSGNSDGNANGDTDRDANRDANEIPPSGDNFTYLIIGRPATIATSWNNQVNPYLVSWGIPIGKSVNGEISAELSNLLPGLISLANSGTGEDVPLDFRHIADMPSERIDLIPLKALEKDQDYRLTIKGAGERDDYPNLRVFSGRGDLLASGSYSVDFYTYSRPTISGLEVFTDEKGRVRVNVTFSEPMRVDDVRNNERPGFLIDDRPVQDCMEPYDDCGYAAEWHPGAKRGYSVMEIDGVDVSITSDFDFDVPEGMTPESSLSFRLPKGIRGVRATLAEGARYDGHAVVEDDEILYRYPISLLKKTSDSASMWTNPGE